MKIPELSEARDQQVRLAIKKVIAFHGCNAPGAVVAAYMVDLAQELLPPLKGKLNAIAESRVCLVDAIQVMTGCTIGNKYLWLKDHGRYALTLYDRDSKDGVRVYVDYPRIDETKYPTLKKFFDGSRTYDFVPRPRQQQMVNEEFYQVRRGVLAARSVKVNLPAKGAVHPLVLCSSCQEYFRPQPGVEQCLCQSETLYEFID